MIRPCTSLKRVTSIIETHQGRSKVPRTIQAKDKLEAKVHSVNQSSFS